MTDLAQFTVAPTDTIRVAMAKIDQNGMRAVVVVSDGKVVGTVSDGDIRRAILHDAVQISPVSTIMQLNPRVAIEGSAAARRAVMERHHLTLLPVVDSEYHLLDVELAYEPS